MGLVVSYWQDGSTPCRVHRGCTQQTTDNRHLVAMPRKRSISLRCPTCRKVVLRSEPEFPFCSERCRLIDLGKWASGGYAVSAPLNDPEM